MFSGAQYSDDDGNIIAFNATTVDKAAFQTVKDCYNYLENATYLSPGQSEPVFQEFNQIYRNLDKDQDRLINTKVKK